MPEVIVRNNINIKNILVDIRRLNYIIKNVGNKPIYVFYYCAYVGNKYNLLVRMYPNVKFIFINPTGFSDDNNSVVLSYRKCKNPVNFLYYDVDDGYCDRKSDSDSVLISKQSIEYLFNSDKNEFVINQCARNSLFTKITKWVLKCKTDNDIVVFWSNRHKARDVYYEDMFYRKLLKDFVVARTMKKILHSASFVIGFPKNRVNNQTLHKYSELINSAYTLGCNFKENNWYCDGKMVKSDTKPRLGKYVWFKSALTFMEPYSCNISLHLNMIVSGDTIRKNDLTVYKSDDVIKKIQRYNNNDRNDDKYMRDILSEYSVVTDVPITFKELKDMIYSSCSF